MTKSEATAIAESARRALANLQGGQMPWIDMNEETKQKILTCTNTATEEIRRIAAMADAELEKRR